MLRHLKERGLIWPAVVAAGGLGILIALGTWQLERRAWKLDLISRIEARAHAGPVSLSRGLEAWRRTGDIEYMRLSARGRFRHDREHFVYMPGREGPGYHVYTPLETPDGRLLLVNRGFVPEELKSPVRRQAGQIVGEVEVVGLARRPVAKAWFTPESDLAHNLYFWPDHANMMGAALEGGNGRPQPVPFFLDAEAEPRNPGGWPKGGVTRLELPNRHLEYAFTWYGLAATLVAVFAVFAWGRLRSATA